MWGRWLRSQGVPPVAIRFEVWIGHEFPPYCAGFCMVAERGSGA